MLFPVLDNLTCKNTIIAVINVTADAANATSAFSKPMLGKYNDKGQRLLSFKNVNGCSIKFQYSKIQGLLLT